MLNKKICFVDFSEQAYTANSLYTQVMPRSRLDLLYLATALIVRPNQVTILSERDDSLGEGGLNFAPLPLNPQEYWAASDFDVVICLDSLEGASQIRPWLPQPVPMVLWSHLPPRHVAMLPLQHESVREPWAAYVFESFYLMHSYHELYALPALRCQYRWPAIVRTLRKRFTAMEQLAAVREKQTTMVFTAHPAYGLGQVLEIFGQIKKEFADLRLRVLLPPEWEAEHEPERVKEIVADARQRADVEVLGPMPWPSYAEKLLSSHLLCHPLAFQNLGCSELIDALGAGCRVVLCEHPGLQEIGSDQVAWLPADPAADYFDRYREALAHELRQMKEDPDAFLESSFNQIARFSTYFTWDLRVWEWESLLFQLIEDAQLPAGLVGGSWWLNRSES